MSSGADDALSLRVDDLQRRVEQLEEMFYDEAEATPPTPISEVGEVVPTGMASAPIAAAAAETSAAEDEFVSSWEKATKDLRTLQAEATADLTEPIRPTGPAEQKPLFDLRFIEEQIAGRALALAGGAALLLGAVFFLSLAFSRGWIGPDLQVALGVAGGSIGLLAGGVLLVRGDRVVGHVLTAVGLAVIGLSLFAASSLYALIDPTIALAGVFVASAVTTTIAVRTDSQVVAGFGLVAVLAAPPVMGARPELSTLIYMVAALTGVSLVSLWRTWSWLPPVAFLLSAPQLYQWIATGPETALAIGALLLYWALMTIAAGGEAFRRSGHDLSITSAPLFLAAGAAVIGLGFLVVGGDTERAAYLLVLAVMHAGVAAFFVRRRGELDPFGLLAGAYGVAIASAAVPLVLGASLTAVVWATEAAALALLAGRRAHGPAVIGAFALYGIAAVRLSVEALQTLAPEAFDAVLSVAPAGTQLASFGFFATIGAVILAVIPARTSRLLVLGITSFVALLMVPLAVTTVGASAPVAVAAWLLIGLVAVSAPGWVGRLPQRTIRWHLGPALRWLRPERELTTEAEVVPLSASVVAVVLATFGTVAATAEQLAVPEIPFTDAAGLSALTLAAGYVLVGMVVDRVRIGVIAGGFVIGIAGLTQLPYPWFVVLWAALSVGAAALSTRDASGRYLSYRHAALVGLGALAVHAVIAAPPSRLFVGAGGIEPHPFLISEASLVLGALAVGLALPAWFIRNADARAAAILAAGAGVTVLYLLSIGIVDVFATEAYGLSFAGRARLDELAKEAQVALSVLWTVTGVAVLAVGLVLKRAALRFAGLVVLTLATTKVFLLDLASLDVAYRVVSLIVLGALLVASAYAWTRMRPGSPERKDEGDAVDGSNPTEEAGEGSRA